MFEIKPSGCRLMTVYHDRFLSQMSEPEGGFVVKSCGHSYRGALRCPAWRALLRARRRPRAVPRTRRCWRTPASNLASASIAAVLLTAAAVVKLPSAGSADNVDARTAGWIRATASAAGVPDPTVAGAPIAFPAAPDPSWGSGTAGTAAALATSSRALLSLAVAAATTASATTATVRGRSSQIPCPGTNMEDPLVPDGCRPAFPCPGTRRDARGPSDCSRQGP
mmetsp:Transcript_93258/g.200148  ORF Transcript_93258/g.200148 Transcript_93258/m.200148 type:complete len:223 (-) Transcript_93258:71-739(-)